jgi:hypothetical protein
MRSCLVIAVAPPPDGGGAADSAAVLADVRRATGAEGVLPAHYELVWHEVKTRAAADDADDADEDARFTVLLSCSLNVAEVSPETESTVAAATMLADLVAEVRGRHGETDC